MSSRALLLAVVVVLLLASVRCGSSACPALLSLFVFSDRTYALRPSDSALARTRLGLAVGSRISYNEVLSVLPVHASCTPHPTDDVRPIDYRISGSCSPSGGGAGVRHHSL